MDGLVLAVFLASVFFGGIVSGLAGFAMGLVVSGIWLHILTPAQTAALIVGYGLLVQTYSIWKLRHALNWRTVAPFIAGGAIGVPLGASTTDFDQSRTICAPASASCWSPTAAFSADGRRCTRSTDEFRATSASAS